MDEKSSPSGHTGPHYPYVIGIMLFAACGVLVFSVISVMIKRQIMRFALKSKCGQHIAICHDVPRSMKRETVRRLERTKDICHEPNLLNNEAKTHSVSATNFDSLQHLYRMKALHQCKHLENRIASRDKTHHRMGREAFDLYLRNQIHSLPIKLQPAKLDEFTALYRHARHEPKLFGKEHYNRMVAVVTELSNTIQGARRRTIQSTAIRPIADIDELTDEALPSVSSRTPTSQFKLPDRIMGLASKVFKKSKRKQEYQTVPSTESLDDINETTQL